MAKKTKATKTVSKLDKLKAKKRPSLEDLCEIFEMEDPQNYWYWWSSLMSHNSRDLAAGFDEIGVPRSIKTLAELKKWLDENY